MRIQSSPSPWAGLAVAFALVSLLPATPLAAQGRGFWFSAGVGTGSHQVACEICRGDRNGGWAARLALGRRVRPRLDLGGEIHGWRDHTDDISFFSFAVLPSLYWRPSAGAKYHLIGGLGFTMYRASDEDESISSSGLGLTLGAGLDVPLTGRYQLTPFATYTASFLANLKHDRTDITNAELSLLQVGFGITRR